MAVLFRKRRRTRRVNSRRRRRNPKVGAHRPRLTFKSGKWFGGKSSRSLLKRGSGIRINRRRRSHRWTRKNPFSVRGITSKFNRNVLMSTAKAGLGIAIGFSAMPLFYKILPQQLKDQRRWLGGIHVALGLSIAGFIKNKTAKDIGLVIAATGVYDLIAMNVEILSLPELRTTSRLLDKIMPVSTTAPATAQAASGGYLNYGSSYPVMAAPVSRVAAAGIGSSFERVGGSYPSLAYPTIGLSGDNGSDLGLDDMIN